MQSSQRLEVGNELVPGGQDAHVLDSASDILPALQLMHCVAASALFAARPAEQQPPRALRRAERRVSVISPESLWLQDGYFWYRVAVSVNSAIAAMFAATTVACLAKQATVFC